jgi:hypothetical protein
MLTSRAAPGLGRVVRGGRAADAGGRAGGRGRRRHRRLCQPGRRARAPAGGRQRPRPARAIATGVGRVEVARPRVDDRRVDPATGQRPQFLSQILPRWCRRSPKVAAVLPLLYLHGLSSSDFVPALTELFGSAGPVGLGDHPAVRALAGRTRGLRSARPVRGGLRGLLGRRCARQHPPGRAGSAVLPGDRGRARRRAKRAGRGRRWHQGVNRRLGRAAGGPAPPWHGRAGGDVGDGRWGCGGRCARFSPPPRAALLGAPKPERNNVSLSVFGLAGVVCAACAYRWRSVVNSRPGSRCCCRI